MKKEQKKNGFTIIEIVISVGIFSIVLTAIVSFALWMNYWSARVHGDRQASGSAERAMEIIAYEIRESIGTYSPTTSASQLSLKTKKYLPTGESYSYIDFFICGEALCMKKESQSPVAITPPSIKVNSLAFSTFLNGTITSVKTSLTVEYKSQSGSPYDGSITTLTSTASGRLY